MINTDSITNTIEEMINKQVEDNNRKMYQFEKNKLYNHIGQYLVNKFKEHKCMIAGGTITSLFTNSEFNDIDVYFRDEKSIIKFVEECWEDNDWINCLTNKSVLVRLDRDKEVQLIHFKYFSNPKEIFETFDFSVCMGAFDFADEQFHLHEEFLKHNSQRILKFNKNTAFPIVSLLRVQKYNKKSYTISKPEFLRIAMKCMTLDIKNVDQLKNHLGGMYGMNYDKLIDFKQDEEFSLERVIDRIENLSLDDDYFKKPEEIRFEDIEDVIDVIKKEEVTIIIVNDCVYRVTHNDGLKFLSTKPVNYKEVSAAEYFKKKKFYKFVRKENDTYYSHYDKSFMYKVGEEVTAKNKHLYFNDKDTISASSYYNNGVVIECKIDAGDFQKKDGATYLAKACRVIREVPQEEWKSWETKEDDEDNEAYNDRLSLSNK